MCKKDVDLLSKTCYGTKKFVDPARLESPKESSDYGGFFF